MRRNTPSSFMLQTLFFSNCKTLCRPIRCVIILPLLGRPILLSLVCVQTELISLPTRDKSRSPGSHVLLVHMRGLNQTFTPDQTQWRTTAVRVNKEFQAHRSTVLDKCSVEKVVTTNTKCNTFFNSNCNNF